MEKISNGIIEIGVEVHGAELKNLKRLSDGREYMFQADPKYWNRTSPVLFPLVGNYRDKRSVYNGKTYEMGQHGFARDMDFRLLEKRDTFVSFELTESPETLARWPFKFRLILSYELKASSVIVGWHVENTGDDTMYYSIGGHPAFICDINDSFFEFDPDEPDILKAGVIEPGGSGTLSDAVKDIPLEGGFLAIRPDLFDDDALIIENRKTSSVSLLDGNKERFLTVRFDAPLFGLWSPAGKNAPFVCIEPWYGRCDRSTFEGNLEDREYGNSLTPGDKSDFHYTIEV